METEEQPARIREHEEIQQEAKKADTQPCAVCGQPAVHVISLTIESVGRHWRRTACYACDLHEWELIRHIGYRA